MSQTERILYIDRALRTSGIVTVQDVADEFEVSTRQVKRDIEYMRDRFEAPVVWKPSKHAYVYGESFKRLEFADQHLVLAYLSMQSMLKNASYFPAVSDELLASFTSQIPKDYLEICDKILYQVPAADSLDPQFFAGICGALRNKLCLEITYKNAKNEESVRKIEPYNLINYGGNWYVVCFDYLRKELRTFHVSRISRMNLTKDSFEDHGKDFAEKVKAHMESGFGIFLGEKTKTVKIQFTGRAAIIVRTQQWHPKQQILNASKNEENGDAVILSFPAAELTEVLAKILSYGPDAVPLEPPELVKMWEESVEQLSLLIRRSRAR